MEKTALSMALAALLLASLEVAALEPATQVVARKHMREQPIWQSRSGDFILTWTTLDVRVVLADTPAQAVFSVIPSVKRSFEAFMASLRSPQAGGGTDADHCTYERTFKILSVVGSLLSLEEAYYAFCQGWAHPAHAQLGLLLPIPAALKRALTLAASRQAGFLMQDQKKIAGTRATSVAFGG